jgi:hypothetical protein
MEAHPKVSQKLVQAKINPIDWPSVPEYVEDCLIMALNNACKQYGDNQYEASKTIKVQM